jgi:hypothetical protein
LIILHQPYWYMAHACQYQRHHTVANGSASVQCP